jgi:uncharacterized membrane protein
MRALLRYFVRGLVLLAPLAITLYVCVLVFTTIDGWLGLDIPGAGFLATVALVTLVGFLASSLFNRGVLGLLSLIERWVERLPFVRLLYSSTKDLLNAFVGERRRFDQPVLVTLLQGVDARALGFVTQRSLGALGLEGYVAVYFPQSYNFAGNLLVVPATHVTPVAADSADVMAFIVSGGVTALGGKAAVEAGPQGAP